jgi:hypothetical protein
MLKDKRITKNDRNTQNIIDKHKIYNNWNSFEKFTYARLLLRYLI